MNYEFRWWTCVVCGKIETDNDGCNLEGCDLIVEFVYDQLTSVEGWEDGTGGFWWDNRPKTE